MLERRTFIGGLATLWFMKSEPKPDTLESLCEEFGYTIVHPCMQMGGNHFNYGNIVGPAAWNREVWMLWAQVQRKQEHFESPGRQITLEIAGHKIPLRPQFECVLACDKAIESAVKRGMIEVRPVGR